MAFPLLAVLAELALTGYKGYQAKKAQDVADRRQGTAALANVTQSMGANQAPARGVTPDSDLLASTGLDEMMQQQLFNQIFKGLLTPKGPAAPG